MDDAEQPISRSEYRRKETEILFEIELLLHRWGISEFIYEEEGQLFRDREGRMVLSRYHAERDRLVGEDR